MKDSDLDTLAHAWRRAGTDCLPTSPAELSRTARSQAAVGVDVCSLRSPTAVVASVSPIPLYLELAEVGWVPWLVAGVSAVGWAACIAWMHLHTVPRLRAEVIRLDELIAALED